jgi:hypothetical protein
LFFFVRFCGPKFHLRPGPRIEGNTRPTTPAAAPLLRAPRDVPERGCSQRRHETTRAHVPTPAPSSSSRVHPSDLTRRLPPTFPPVFLQRTYAAASTSSPADDVSVRSGKGLVAGPSSPSQRRRSGRLRRDREAPCPAGCTRRRCPAAQRTSSSLGFTRSGGEAM